MFAFVLPVGLVSFLHPFFICSETSKAIAFDLYNGVIIILIGHFVGCKLFVSFHSFTPHFSIPLHG
jgi:hypothetical protein